MLSAREPNTEAVRSFLSDQVDLPFSYPEVGASRMIGADGKGAPRGYAVDHHREPLGSGREVFERAKRGVEEWKMFSLDWMVLCWPYLRIAPGEVCAVLAMHMGFWSMNAARIIYVIDEERRFGFGYGTLPGHCFAGEERFLLEWLPDDSVWYQVTSFSRPRHWMARVGYPVARLIQKRFGPQSAEALIDELLENKDKPGWAGLPGQTSRKREIR